MSSSVDDAESGCMIQVIPPSANSLICESVYASKNCSQTAEEIIWILSTEQKHIHDIIFVLKYLLLKAQLHSEEQLFVVLGLACCFFFFSPKLSTT